MCTRCWLVQTSRNVNCTLSRPNRRIRTCVICLCINLSHNYHNVKNGRNSPLKLSKILRWIGVILCMRSWRGVPVILNFLVSSKCQWFLHRLYQGQSFKWPSLDWTGHSPSTTNFLFHLHYGVLSPKASTFWQASLFKTEHGGCFKDGSIVIFIHPLKQELIMSE